MNKQHILVLDDGWIDANRNTYNIVAIKLEDVSTILFSENNDITISLKNEVTFTKENEELNNCLYLVSLWDRYLREYDNVK